MKNLTSTAIIKVYVHASELTCQRVHSFFWGVLSATAGGNNLDKNNNTLRGVGYYNSVELCEYKKKHMNNQINVPDYDCQAWIQTFNCIIIIMALRVTATTTMLQLRSCTAHCVFAQYTSKFLMKPTITWHNYMHTHTHRHTQTCTHTSYKHLHHHLQLFHWRQSHPVPVQANT